MTYHFGEDWMERLDDAEIMGKTGYAFPDQELWEVRQHLKRKLTFYLRERVRDRWTVGGFHPVQVVSAGCHAQPLCPDDRFCPPLCHL
ncbi:MAG: hypothetical protein MZV64_62550 [Ignavibacteriales bacterium]|nr:hypothetical protein [Ignavibacteriales bacterium]